MSYISWGLAWVQIYISGPFPCFFFFFNFTMILWSLQCMVLVTKMDGDQYCFSIIDVFLSFPLILYHLSLWFYYSREWILCLQLICPKILPFSFILQYAAFIYIYIYIASILFILYVILLLCTYMYRSDCKQMMGK